MLVLVLCNLYLGENSKVFKFGENYCGKKLKQIVKYSKRASPDWRANKWQTWFTVDKE